MKKAKGIKVVLSLGMAVMTLFSATPLTAMAATCTTKNNHSIECGNIGKWFSSQSKIVDCFDNERNLWGEKFDNGEITWCEYVYNVPCGYECWSCAYCGKWSGNYKYRNGTNKTCQWNAGIVTKVATCTSTGIKTYTCTVCNSTKTETIPKKAHSYKTTVELPNNAVHVCTMCGDEHFCKSAETGSYKSHTVTKATLKSNGTISDATCCSYCDLKLNENIKYISQIESVVLNKNAYTYNSKVKTPTVIVKDVKGKALVKNTDYTVSYANGRKAVGAYSVKITFKGNYAGSKTLYFKILPKGTKLSSVKPKKQTATVRWVKQPKQITGYQIQYSTSKKFKKSKSVTVKGYKKTSATIKKLKKGKKYFVRIRTYKVDNGKKFYSSWSKVKGISI